MTMIIDVRTPAEYGGGHIENSVNIPVDAIMAGDFGALAGGPKDTLMQLYCRSGARADYAQQVLQSAGFSRVTILGGVLAAIQALA